MEILWCTKAPRADIYSQFVSALRTTVGCVKRRSRRAGPMCPAGTNAVFCGGTHGSRPTRCGGHTGRTESSAPTHLVIASQSADWRGNPFSHKEKDGFPRQ